MSRGDSGARYIFAGLALLIVFGVIIAFVVTDHGHSHSHTHADLDGVVFTHNGREVLHFTEALPLEIPANSAPAASLCLVPTWFAVEGVATQFLTLAPNGTPCDTGGSVCTAGVCGPPPTV